MSEVLSQREIEELLAVTSRAFFDEAGYTCAWKSLDEFHSFITKRDHVPEKHYGIFEKDISVCRFFDDKKGESILADIIAKNTQTGMGNVNIPGTDVKLVNYSYCPKCETIYTQQDLKDYYNKPAVRPGNNLRYTLRKETRVICKNCETPFLPTLIIVDRSPKNSVQYLCRMQVIDAVEVFMTEEYGESVLTKNLKNIISRNDGCVACLNDLEIRKLEKKPTFITNFIQYSPPPLILNFIDGTNVEKGDVVFDSWRKKPTKEYEAYLTRLW